jgi:hypothetical protein
MSSVPTQKELKELFQNNKCFPVDYKGCVVMTDEALREKGGEALLMVRDLVRYVCSMCKTRTTRDGVVSREDVIFFYDMAFPLLMEFRKENLRNLHLHPKTVAQYAYQQVLSLHLAICDWIFSRTCQKLCLSHLCW